MVCGHMKDKSRAGHRILDHIYHTKLVAILNFVDACICLVSKESIRATFDHYSTQHQGIEKYAK
jgi:hypothetical protein